MAKLNVRLECGKGKRPRAKKGKARGKNKKEATWTSECLIKVFAICDIEEGAELLTTYGEGFWLPKPKQ
jgi:hypothetical protein